MLAALSLAEYQNTVAELGIGYDPEVAEAIVLLGEYLGEQNEAELRAERGPNCDNWGPPHPYDRW
jgi:hypothetical protein